MKKNNTYTEIGKNVKFGKDCVLRNFIFIGKNTRIGNRVKIANFCEIGSGCRIGNDVNLQTGVILTPETVVGDNCFFAGQVAVADEKYPSVGIQIRKPVIFGKKVVVGMGAKLIGGIKVGENSVIGMGAIVVNDVPPNSVVAGMPAKVVSTRKEYDRKKRVWEKNKNQVLKAKQKNPN